MRYSTQSSGHSVASRRSRSLIAILVLALVAFAPATVFSQTAPGPIAPGPGESYASSVQSKTIIVTTQTGNGSPIDYPDDDADGGEVTAAEVILGQGAATGWHKHAFPVYAYVLSGTLAVEYGDHSERIFRTGEAIIEVVGVPHNGRTVGNETVRLIVFYTGLKGKTTTFKLDPPK